MSLFEFIMGMISVILALAIAQLFVGVAELMQRRAARSAVVSICDGRVGSRNRESSSPSGNFPRRSSSHNYSVLARIGIGQHTGGIAGY